MNYVLHLTDACNLNCKYCYENKKCAELSVENIKSIIDYEISNKSKTSHIGFYGGEPLLKKDLIYTTIEYIKSKKSKTKFSFGITTNGTLIDDEFIEFMKKNDFINIAYSFDGDEKVQNLNRVTADGRGTFEVVFKNAKKLLEAFDYTAAMVVVTKNNVRELENSVNFLINTGFKIINLLFDYTENWQDEDLDIIRTQFEKVGEIYYQKIKSEKDISILLFESKIKSYINEKKFCGDECTLGMKNVNIGTDGNIYPCMQLVDTQEFIIGNCKKGIDKNAREKLINNSQKELEVCKTCAIRKRCKHTCACRNYMTTKDINEVSPIVCEIERMTIEIADNVAGRLYKENSKLFLQKFYNNNYDIINAIIEKI